MFEVLTRANISPGALEAGSDGTFTIDLSDEWNGLGGGPLGGYTFAAGLQALATIMPFPEPLVASAYFLRPAVAGPANVNTSVVRSGRTVATGEASVVQRDREIVRMLATFGDLDAVAGPSAVNLAPPRLAPPEECVDPMEGIELPGVSVTERVDYRFEQPPGWQAGRPSGAAEQEFWMRPRDLQIPTLLSMALFVDAAAPAVLELGAIGSSTLELTVHFRGRPTTPWMACRCSTRALVNGLHEEDFEIWDVDGRLLAQSRQLAIAL